MQARSLQLLCIALSAFDGVNVLVMYVQQGRIQ